MEICVGMIDTYARAAAKALIVAYEAIFCTKLFLYRVQGCQKHAGIKIHKRFQ
jgi:hypothetical protein